MSRSERNDKVVVPTASLISRALAAGHRQDAARLAPRLAEEWAEIRFLYPEFLRRLVGELRRAAAGAERAEEVHRRLFEELGDDYEAGARQRCLEDLLERFPAACEAGSGTDQLSRLLADWRQLHDRWRDLFAWALSIAVEVFGESRLGWLWHRIQEEEIAGYQRYDPAVRPWEDSFEEIVGSAITGMHGHLCGPGADGELTLEDRGGHVEIRFEPCGSGGRLRAEGRFGVTTRRYDWAWNKIGVCHYCVHCCVLQQLEPIERFGVPVRVIEPPLKPGDPCRWRVYRSPELVPEQAYTDVGKAAPGGS